VGLVILSGFVSKMLRVKSCLFFYIQYIFYLLSQTGKAGNPEVMAGVTMVVGVTTDVIAGEGLIITAGGIDSRIQSHSL
jgi:hypothetical protein